MSRHLWLCFWYTKSYGYSPTLASGKCIWIDGNRICELWYVCKQMWEKKYKWTVICMQRNVRREITSEHDWSTVETTPVSPTHSGLVWQPNSLRGSRSFPRGGRPRGNLPRGISRIYLEACDEGFSNPIEPFFRVELCPTLSLFGWTWIYSGLVMIEIIRNITKVQVLFQIKS